MLNKIALSVEDVAESTGVGRNTWRTLIKEKKKRKPLRLQRPNFSSVVRRAFLSYVRFSDPCVKNIFRRERLFIGGLLFKNLLVYILLKTLPSFQENYPVLLI